MKKLSLIVILSALTVILAINAGSAAVDSHSALNSSTLANRAACSAALRGLVWNVEAGASTADYQSVCHQDATDAYSWASSDY